MSAPQFEIRLCESMPELEQMEATFQRAWQGTVVVPPDLAAALVHVGAFAATAHLDGQIVGASFAARGAFEGQTVLHSHVTAAMVSGAGYALKKFQFDWAKRNDIDVITWTFDPLVRRNCVFNLEKLGATVREYLPNFYGEMEDAINLGDVSDRLFAFWPTASEQPPVPQVNPHNILINAHGQFSDCAKDEPVLVYLPADIESMRRSNDPTVSKWRTNVREALEPLLNNHWTISRMHNREALIVEPPKGH